MDSQALGGHQASAGQDQPEGDMNQGLNAWNDRKSLDNVAFRGRGEGKNSLAEMLALKVRVCQSVCLFVPSPPLGNVQGLSGKRYLKL